MSAKLRDTKVLAGVVLAAVVVIVAGGWILLVSPEKSKVTKLDVQISDVNKQITQRKIDLATPKADVHVRASDVFRLNRAMPDATDMSGILVSLNQLAGQRKLEFQSLTPAAPVTQTGFNTQPITVVVQGSFSSVSGYLGDLRKLVTVKKRSLSATGRLFSVDSVTFSPPDDKAGFPKVKATLIVDAFTFAGGVLPTTTDPSTTPSTAANGTVAAGANP